MRPRSSGEVITYGLALFTLFTSSGCAAPRQISPEDATLQRRIECRDGERSADKCGRRVDFAFFKPRFDRIEALVLADTTISSRSRDMLQTALRLIVEMDKEGRISWYETYQEDLIGSSVVGRSRLPFLPGATDFYAKVLLPRAEGYNEADYLGVTTHETMHAALDYWYFRKGADPLDVTDSEFQEEYSTYFYGFLVGMLARNSQQPNLYDREGLIKGEGIDVMQAVYYLDSMGRYPDSRITQYILDMRMRTIGLKRIDFIKRHPDLPEAEQRIDQYLGKVARIDIRWQGFDQIATDEERMIIRHIADNDWTVPGFFQFTP